MQIIGRSNSLGFFFFELGAAAEAAPSGPPLMNARRQLIAGWKQVDTQINNDSKLPIKKSQS